MSLLSHKSILFKEYCDDYMIIKSQLTTKHQEIDIYLHIRLQRIIINIEKYKAIFSDFFYKMR